MNILNTLFMALKEIGRNAMRSVLTALGIVIGVGAVIAMVHLGEAATQSVTDQISSLGQNLLIVTPGTRTRGPGGTRASADPFTDRQVKALTEQVTNALIAPTAVKGSVVVAGNANWPTQIHGVTETYMKVRDRVMAEGRAFEDSELRSASPVCIVGPTVVEELFGEQSALDAAIRVGKLACRIVGVLESKQSTMGSDNDDLVLVPLRTFQRRIAGNWDVPLIYVSANERSQIASVQGQLEQVLREQRRIPTGGELDFTVRNMEEIAKAVSGTTEILTMLLGAIAGVSLLVGGIGIMNIMLVSVTERTREIGIRLAIGARGQEVLLQFLVEAAVLSTIGGLIGIGLGLGGSYLAATKLDMPFVLVPNIVIIAFVFSAGVGLVFGYWPARKAARLDPIEALRHE